MKNKILFFFLGILIGISVFYIYEHFLHTNTYKYVELQEDYQVENLGTVKKGLMLRVDEAMSEGFTRYILYLNLKGGNIKPILSDKPEEIIPYWLNPIEKPSK